MPHPVVHRLRRHANGWIAEATSDETGRWWASAYPRGQGGAHFLAASLDAAEEFADSQIPGHRCSFASCGHWNTLPPVGDVSQEEIAS